MCSNGWDKAQLTAQSSTGTPVRDNALLHSAYLKAPTSNLPHWRKGLKQQGLYSSKVSTLELRGKIKDQDIHGKTYILRLTTVYDSGSTYFSFPQLKS